MSNTKKMREIIKEIVEYYSKDLEFAKSADSEAIVKGMENGEETPELKSVVIKVMKRTFDLNDFLMRIDAIFDDSAGTHPSVETSDDSLYVTTMQYYQVIRARIIVSVANFDKLLPYILQTHPDINLFNCEDLGKVFGEILLATTSIDLRKAS